MLQYFNPTLLMVIGYAGFLLTTELVLSVINLCPLLPHPLPITCCVLLWLALCQQLFYLNRKWFAQYLQMTAHVWMWTHAVVCIHMHCLNLYVTFYYVTQGLQGLAGAKGEKVNILLTYLIVSILITYGPPRGPRLFRDIGGL